MTRIYSPDADVIVGRWKDGRLGEVRALRPYGKFGAVAFYKDQKVEAIPDLQSTYAPLLEQIVKFMRTGSPPVDNQETLEIFSFLDAAQRSREADGKPERLR